MTATHTIVIDHRTAPVAAGAVMAQGEFVGPGELVVQRRGVARGGVRELELGERAAFAEWHESPGRFAPSDDVRARGLAERRDFR